MNYTLPEIARTGTVLAGECRDWCLQQHYSHDYAPMWLLLLAQLSFGIGVVIMPEEGKARAFMATGTLLVWAFLIYTFLA